MTNSKALVPLAEPLEVEAVAFQKAPVWLLTSVG